MSERPKFVLGVDLGPSSIGWSLIDCENEKPVRIRAAGVRRFDAGVSGDIEKGKDESRATQRRDARGPRRQHWRRQWRLTKVFRLLSRQGLLPPTQDGSADQRHEVLLLLDKDLRKQSGVTGDRVTQHVFPYMLRKQALDQKLEPFALGRALYHLAQRRGYKSNRKAEGDEDERGVVKQGISELAKQIKEQGARTLGEFFADLDPEEHRIRKRWTARGMFLHEFEEIWQSQAKHHPEVLTTEFKAQLHAAMFDQRPLKSQSHLIGRCSLEPDRKRAPLACMAAQRFRLLQRVNDLEVLAPDGEVRCLETDERAKIVAEIEKSGDITWATVRKLLGFKKSKEYKRNYTFNFEEGGDKKLLGNRTAGKMFAVLGDTWADLQASDQAELIDEILSFESEEALAARLAKAWDFSPGDAAEVAGKVFEAGYASHSRKAINKLLPRLEEGVPYATARKEVYGEELKTQDPLDALPPLLEAFDEVRNPAVARAVSELRKVVNGIIRTHGKPDRIRVEMARDLKHSRKRREQFSKTRDENTKKRKGAEAEILKELGEQYVSHANILKVRLANECGWRCPYTDRGISMDTLVQQPQFDIEHIIPFSRSFDNSYINKTLCHHETNRHQKGNKTPYEAFGHTDEWDEMIARVKRFQGPADVMRRKLERFQARELPDADEFTNRQLSDTRYLSVVARDYLALLFGGITDESGKQRVQTLPGRCTGYLRRVWNLNSILGHPDNKNRADHRHHAVDAIIIALTDAGMVQQLSRAAEHAEERGLHDLFVEVDPPWEDFLSDVRSEIDGVVVSSRVKRRLNGQLHKDTILSKPFSVPGDKEITRHHVRKPLNALSVKEVDSIVDEEVKRLVKRALDASGLPPDKAFAEPTNHPHFISKKDPRRIIPIHSARIRKSDKPMPVGAGSKRRYVNPGSNHHMEIVADLDEAGNEKRWKGIIVSRFEAVQRKQRGEPIIQREHGDKRRFKFSLMGGEHVVMDAGEQENVVCRATVISQGQIEFVAHQDARPITIRKKIAGARIRCAVDRLRLQHAKKVLVDVIGEIVTAND